MSRVLFIAFTSTDTARSMFANVDHSHPEVRHDLFHWIQWLASQVPLSGLRLDAIKHYSASFLKDFVRHIDATVGRDWFLVGEYWREDSEVLAKYIEYMDHRLSLFDVRLVSNFSRLSMCPNADLRSVFDGTLVGRKPANAVVSFWRSASPEGQRMYVLTDDHDRLSSPTTTRFVSSCVLASFSLHANLAPSDGRPIPRGMYPMLPNPS